MTHRGATRGDPFATELVDAGCSDALPALVLAAAS